MGLLSWLFGPRAPRLRLSIWVDEASRLQGLARAVRADLQAGRSVVLVAHFAASLIEAGRQLAEAGIEFETLPAWRPLGPKPSVVAILAKTLPQPLPGATPRHGGGQPQTMVRGVELHVLARENDRLVRFAASLPTRCEVHVATSLDAAVLASHCSPHVKALLVRMGFKADEPIESALVTKSLLRHLRKVEARVRRDLPADSIAQWVERNVDRK